MPRGSEVPRHLSFWLTYFPQHSSRQACPCRREREDLALFKAARHPVAGMRPPSAPACHRRTRCRGCRLLKAWPSTTEWGPPPEGEAAAGRGRACSGGVGGTMTTKARPRASAHTGPAWCFKLESEASPASSEGCAMSLSGDLNVKMVLVPLLSGHRTQALNDGLDEKRSACCSGS